MNRAGSRTRSSVSPVRSAQAGGVLVNVTFRQSFLAYQTGDAAYLGFIALYAACACLTWLVYLRAAGRRRLAGV